LGPSACQVSAHYLNLLGLSVTTTTKDGGAAICDPSITHTTTKDGVWAPRALLVDHHHHQQQQQQQQSGGGGGTAELDGGSSKNHANELGISTSLLSPQGESSSLIQSSALWSGGVERVDIFGSSSFSSSQHQQQNQQQQHQQQQQLQWNRLQETARQLSYSAHSRYRHNINRNSNHNSNNNTHGQSLSSKNNRTVDWDDLPDEEEDEEEDEQDYQERQRRETLNWNYNTYPQLQQGMETFWDQAFSDNTHTNALPTQQPQHEDPSPRTTVGDGDAPTTTVTANNDTSNDLLSRASWRDYWMPPYNPARSILDLPVPPTASPSLSSWDLYYPTLHHRNDALTNNDWPQEVFLDESVRSLLEDCDSCQGIVVAASGHGAYAGLATQLLQYLQQECPGARRWIWSLEESLSMSSSASSASSLSQQEDSESWRTRRIHQLRHHLQGGLKWQDYAESAHMILALQAPPSQGHQSFQTSARMAAALETVTLSYRLSTAAARLSRVGLNSYYYGSVVGDSPFGTAQRLSLSEFLTNLQPSPGLPVLELDAMSMSTTTTNDEEKDSSSLATHILQGTSLERDQRMRQQHSSTGRQRDVLPGAWMLDASNQQPGEKGLLSSLSYTAPVDRSVHTHFALASGLRYQNDAPWKIATSPTPSSSSDKYVDCLLQGMGLRYRPESSLAVHLNQDLTTLTDGYGAGSYWKHVCKATKHNGSPVLSVLGNSTRCHGQVAQLGAHVKEALAPSQKGWLQRDVTNGVLPEADDCHEILSSLYGLRDRYQPPSHDNDDGAFYDY